VLHWLCLNVFISRGHHGLARARNAAPRVPSALLHAPASAANIGPRSLTTYFVKSALAHNSHWLRHGSYTISSTAVCADLLLVAIPVPVGDEQLSLGVMSLIVIFSLK
jgi:hypothetical protein